MSSLTPKQEKFCQKYIETGNASEAYRQAYDTSGMKSATINRTAKALLDNHKITARLANLQERHQKRHEVTVDSITEELNENRQHAIMHGQIAAANGASLGKAKLHGLILDKAEVTGKDGAPLKFTITIGDGGDDK